MTDQPALLTSSWTAVWRHDKASPPPRAFVPVRISIGSPRFWPQAKGLPDITELMPWGLMKIPDEEFVPRYRARLERYGAGAIQARFDKLHELYRRPLMLLCFEKDVAVGTVPPTAFADWWLEQDRPAGPRGRRPRRRRDPARAVERRRSTCRNCSASESLSLGRHVVDIFNHGPRRDDPGRTSRRRHAQGDDERHDLSYERVRQIVSEHIVQITTQIWAARKPASSTPWRCPLAQTPSSSSRSST